MASELTNANHSFQSQLGRTFRFGVQQPRAATRSAWLELARRSEAAGFSTLLVPDHFGGPLAPFVALMAAADATAALRVGTRVLANDFRNPVLLAQEAATLDLLTDGRLELGLGAGWMSEDYESTGVRFDPAGVRIDRLEEAIQVIRALFSGGSLTQIGKHYRISHHRPLPRPKQDNVPIMLGGGSRKILELAGRVANIVSIHADLRRGSQQPGPTTADATQRKIDWVRHGAGERFEEIELEVGIDVICRTDHTSHALDEWSRRLRVPVPRLETMSNVLIGSQERILELCRRRRERFGLSYLVFHGRDLDTAAPIVQALAGT
jgi:probable F420-dependent oxidoreductase